MDFELMKASNLQLYIRVDFATQGFLIQDVSLLQTNKYISQNAHHLMIIVSET